MDWLNIAWGPKVFVANATAKYFSPPARTQAVRPHLSEIYAQLFSCLFPKYADMLLLAGSDDFYHTSPPHHTTPNIHFKGRNTTATLTSISRLTAGSYRPALTTKAIPSPTSRPQRSTSSSWTTAATRSKRWTRKGTLW